MNKTRPLARRYTLSIASLALLAGALPVHAGEPATRRLNVTVAETAGIRRFGYPVDVVLTLPEPVEDARHFRLLDRGKPIVAQFRPHGVLGRGIQAVSLDFTVNHGPLEMREYVVEYGSGIARGPEPAQGVHIDPVGDEFHVSHPAGLQFVIPRNLLGLLRQVRAGKTDYLRPESTGLVIRYKDDIHYRAGGVGPYGVATVGRMVKSGPLASTLRFESVEALRGNRSVVSTVEMEFPLSKSWINVTWEVDDPHSYVAGLGADLALNLVGEPVLVDFGAGSLVYAALPRGQTAQLRAGSISGDRLAPRWETLVGPVGAPQPYVVATPGAATPAAEGWAHVMDRQRCTAVALAGFSQPCQESDLTLAADGRLQLWKHFARGGAVPPAGPKKVVFWLHFVGMPVHVGAVTSSQAMLAPLRVTVRAHP